MQDIAGRVAECARDERLPAGGTGRVLPLAAEAWLAQDLGISRREVQMAALLQGIMPRRYLRNQGNLSVEGQLRLLASRAAMVGLGGLGGHVLEILARMGVGCIRAADADVFEEHNLNRQLLSTQATLGMPKAEAAVLRVHDLNPAVTVEALQDYLIEETLPKFLDGAQLALDCLGGLASRLALQRAAAMAGIPLITGAMAGLTGYVAVVRPGQPGPAEFLGQGSSAEDTLGTPAQSVAVVASLLAAEAVRLLTGKPSPLAGGMLLIDLAEMRFERVSLG
ncbi:HesA/MoeB/ThiF family protein [Desulfocurvibacter africanus]|uniref:HesA/MoeB/ThiF family protein n=1 Tax=Desulfocurvibacter africanus TaxID=873 RepID=UPI00042514D9|nr:HesA/MoeB/ThiF family protein [Desulfocurvibacter africanus]